MRAFVIFVEFLVAIGVGITAVRIYLKINKIWKRKHEKVVAESISIFAALLGIFIGVPFIIKFVFIDKSISPALNVAIATGGTIVRLAMGMGLWVRVNEGAGFLKLFMQALNLERRESGDLIKSFLRPQGAEKILNILQKVSAIDNEIAEEEIKLINEFAQQWKIKMPELNVGQTEGSTNLLDLRRSVEEYLEIQPPSHQAAELIDILGLIIKADSAVTKEEELIFGELTGLINDYVNKDDEPKVMYEVLLVPQSDTQIETIRTLLTDVELVDRRGGRAFSVGKFYSFKYAEAICKKYIELNLFADWDKSITINN